MTTTSIRLRKNKTNFKRIFLLLCLRNLNVIRCMKNSTSITGLIAPVITREVIMENEIVDLNVLFLNLNTIFQVLFTIYIPSINAAFFSHRSFCTCRTVGFFLRLEKAYASVVFFLGFYRIDVGMFQWN